MPLLFEAQADKPIFIGRHDTHETIEVVFDVGHIIKAIDGASFDVLFTPYGRGDNDAYPVRTELHGDKLHWIVTESDTATVGTGKCEVIAFVDGKRWRSEIYTTKVLKSLSAGGEVPEGYRGWVNEVLEAGSDAHSFAAEAAEYAQRIEDLTVEAVTLPAGSGAHVSKNLTEEGWNFKFGIPAGQQGVTGPQGPAGPQGPQGQTGPRGPRGIPGKDGNDYVLTEADKQYIAGETEKLVDPKIEEVRVSLNEDIAKLSEDKADKSDTYTKTEVDTLVDGATPKDYAALKKQVATLEDRNDALWKLSEGQVWDSVDKEETGVNEPPKGAKYQTLIEAYGNTTQDAYHMGYAEDDVVAPTPMYPSELKSVEEIHVKHERDGEVLASRTITPPRPLNRIGDYVDTLDVESGLWKYNIADVDVPPIATIVNADVNGLGLYIEYRTSRYESNLYKRDGARKPISNKFKDYYHSTNDAINKFNNGIYSIGANSMADGHQYVWYYLLPNIVCQTVEEANAFVGSVKLMDIANTPTTEPVNPEDLTFLRSLAMIPSTDVITVTDQSGRDVSYLLNYIRKLDEVN